MSAETPIIPTDRTDVPPLDPPEGGAVELPGDGPKRINVAVTPEEWSMLEDRMRVIGADPADLHRGLDGEEVIVRGDGLDLAFFGLMAVGAQVDHASWVEHRTILIRHADSSEVEVMPY